MIELVNKRSGLIFMVADERKEEYLAAGHRLAAEVCAKKPIEEKAVETKPKKAATKKATKAKK